MSKNSLRNKMLDLLLRIEQGSGYSHLLIDHEIKTNTISVKDKALLTEVVYGTIQRKITLDYFLKNFINTKKKQKPWVTMLLRMSLYQMVFLDKVPDHAIIHEAVEIAKQRGHKGIASFVNGVLRSVQRKGVPHLVDIKNPIERLSIQTSHPEWMVKQWVDNYGYDITKEICENSLTHKPISVRIQPLKIQKEEVIQQLKEEGFVVESSKLSSQGLIIKEGNILYSSLFKKGFLTIQDQSSMLVGEMLDAYSGMTVLDTCSAPGGKVTHIAELMNDDGVIKAHDLHTKKVELIDNKMKQLSLSIIDASQADARELQNKYAPETFDRILVDAPCSGLGVLKGKPDVKYNKTKQDLYQLAKIQLDILNHVSPLLKKDGYLLYSTCTVNKIENDEVIRYFLEENKNFKVDEKFFNTLPTEVKTTKGITDVGLQLFPQTFETDGFFLSRMIKIG